MSFIQTDNTACSYSPGYFLINGDEGCVRETRELPQSLATTLSDGRKIVKMGTFFPANSSGTVEGIVYEDIDVTSGAMPGSVVTKGNVYLDRLPASPESGVQSALEGKGFKFKSSAPDVARPKWETNGSLSTISVASEAGSDTGTTKLTLTGYTQGAGESYKYKIADLKAPSVYYGQELDSTWTAWNGTSDITAESDKMITIASVDSTGAVVAAGSATVTAKS